MKSKEQIREAIGKARLHKVNAYCNADFEGFIDEEVLLKSLEME